MENPEPIKITLAEIIQDFDFQDLVRKHLNELVAKRRMRPEPPEGKRYERDWYDRMGRSSLTVGDCLMHIGDIWSKKSNLNSETRGVIQHICNLALQDYLEQKKLVPAKTLE
jgi:hypothetical protein